MSPCSDRGSLMMPVVAGRVGFATMGFFFPQESHGLSVHHAPPHSQSSSVTLAGSTGLDSC